MPKKEKAPSGSDRLITLRRDKKGALRFNGQRIGAATRNEELVDDDENDGNAVSYEISARLFKTAGGKYVAGVEVYNQTEERYAFRDGAASDSLQELASILKETASIRSWLDDDILGELFEDTEIADSFIVHID
jgi:hypothetical protein